MGLNKIKVAAIGRTEYLYQSILELGKKGFEIVLIISCKESPEYKKKIKDFRLLAKKIKCDFLATEKINTAQVKKLIKKNKPDVAISLNWKTIIGKEIIESFPLGIINAHCGDLPRYRGNAVPNWAILNREKEIVLTLHLMAEELDAGPILLKKKMILSKNTYIGNVYKFFSDNLPIMYIKAINGLVTGRIKPKRQPTNSKLSLRCYPRIPEDSEINWQKSAEEISRLIRASAEPFSGAYTFLNSKKLIIWRAYSEKPKFPFLGMFGQVAERRKERGEVAVIAGDNTFLIIKEAELEKQGRKKATDIIKSNRTRLGLNIIKEIENLRISLKNKK